jgi:hypothetical protein
MPVFIHLSNLIIPKSIIANKYPGGIETFLKTFEISGVNRHQEDDELFSLASMNSDEFDLLIGLDFDRTNQTSSDFVIVNRYGGPAWKVRWLGYNVNFAWHIDCDETLIKKAKATAEMTMDEVMRLTALGENPFRTIFK